MDARADMRICELFGIDHPIVQAPMAGASTVAMAIGAARGGGLGSIACALMNADEARNAVREFRAGTDRPLNLNFFAHENPPDDPLRALKWRADLAPYYIEANLDPALPPVNAGRAPFDEDFCALVEELRPEIISFHFGLPNEALLKRAFNTGAKIMSSATTVAEARWLAAKGVHAIIAMGADAGGHRGTFLPQFGPSLVHRLDMASQAGTFALVPQIVDAVSVPVIAAGGIGDRRGVAAAMALGASAVQVGTAFLFTPEAKLSAAQRAGLADARDDNTMITNLYTGRPARAVVSRLMRELGPFGKNVPDFPLAGGALVPLRAGGTNRDFANAWSGQAARLAPRDLTSEQLVQYLAGLPQSGDASRGGSAQS